MWKKKNVELKNSRLFVAQKYLLDYKFFCQLILTPLPLNSEKTQWK